jgi:hypothetical protein
VAYCPPAPVLDVPSVEKVPGSVLNYGFDLSPPAYPQENSPWAPPGKPKVPWLAPGEQVISLTVTFGPGSVSTTQDLTLVDTQITANATGVAQSLIIGWIAGGLAGNTYLVTYTWITNSTPVGRTDSRSMNIVCVAAL